MFSSHYLNEKIYFNIQKLKVQLILQTLDINNDAFSKVFNCSMSSKNMSSKPTSYTKTSRTDKSSCNFSNPLNSKIVSKMLYQNNIKPLNNYFDVIF